MKKLLAVIIIMLLFGCHGKAQESTQIGDFNVEFLFEHDGIRMYRFGDGNKIYFTSNGEVQWHESSGKTSQKREVN